MDLREMFDALVRRWRLAILALVASVVLATAAFIYIGPRYVASSTLVPMPPQSVIASAQRDQAYAPNNPLLYLSTLTNARDVLVSSLSSSHVASQLKERAPGTTIAAAADPTSGSPMIDVTSEAKTEAAALGGVRAMDDIARASLASVQDSLDVQSSNRVSLLVLVQDKQAKVVRKKQLEYTVVAFVFCSVAFLLAIALLDSRTHNHGKKGTPLPAHRRGGTTNVDNDDGGAAAGTSSVERMSGESR